LERSGCDLKKLLSNHLAADAKITCKYPVRMFCNKVKNWNEPFPMQIWSISQSDGLE
jgi:hypothetical protein